MSSGAQTPDGFVDYWSKAQASERTNAQPFLIALADSGPVRGRGAWDDAMIRARGQAERYARALPADEPAPPFLLVVDVGHSLVF